MTREHARPLPGVTSREAQPATDGVPVDAPVDHRGGRPADRPQRVGPRLALLSPIVDPAALGGPLVGVDPRPDVLPAARARSSAPSATRDVQQRLPGDILASVSRILIGFAIGSGLGLATGLILGHVPHAAAAADPGLRGALPGPEDRDPARC